MAWQFEILREPSSITEGPAWDGSGLLFTDINNSRILRYDAGSSEISMFRTGTNRANGLMLDKEGRLYGCEQGTPDGPGGRRIVRYEADGGVTVICDNYQGKKFNSPNDLAVDEQGRIWFTDPRYGDNRNDMELDHESVYRADPQSDGNWLVTRVTYDTTAPNGLLLSPDNKTLYVAQSKYGEGEKRELRAYPIRNDGSVGEYQVLHNFYPHRGIDGMCLDTEGNIVATAGWEVSGPGGMIYVFAANGRVLETHPLPCQRPTNCTFGGEDLRTLYVTSIEGHLLRAHTERQGLLHYPPRPAA
ncbi:MAG: SMP-30/gluconolactonase/LRE family protein [Caldilineaceae bacterium]|nr:SMP-30/gluconolactonase/LRE family protein [Caldilineaceae bacterium]